MSCEIFAAKLQNASKLEKKKTADGNVCEGTTVADASN
jgi:hypothetical protein